MEKPQSFTMMFPRMKLRGVLVSVTVLFWWALAMMHSPSLDGRQTMERREELRIAEVAGGSRLVRQAEVVEEKKLIGGNGSGDGSMGSVGGSGDGELGIRKSDDLERNLGGGYGSGNGNADEHSVRKARTSSVVGNLVDLNSGQGNGDGAIVESKLIGTRNPRSGSSVEEKADADDDVNGAGGQNVRKERTASHVVENLVDPNSDQGNSDGAISKSKFTGTRKPRPASLVEDKSDADAGANGVGGQNVRKESTASVVENLVEPNSGQGNGSGAIAESKFIGTRKPRPASSVEEKSDAHDHYVNGVGGQNIRKEGSFLEDDNLGGGNADEQSVRKESTASVAGNLVEPNSKVGKGNGDGAIAESKLMGTRKPRTEFDGDDEDVNGVGDQSVKDEDDASVGTSSIPEKVVDECEGRYVYEHKMDPYFNSDLLKQCKKLNIWQDLCPMLGNGGLGPKLNNTSGVFSDSDWYQTNQFMLEQIFHNRMRGYKCLTNDSKQADVIFVPFYAGFEISMNLWGANITVRDTAPNRLFNWLTAQPEWKRFNGHDHFLVGGRITWDFRRETDEEKDWGNKLFILPPSLNMTMLAIEASPFHHNDVAVPYPTYFHPSSTHSMQNWQARMRTMERKSLFSFVGAPRPNYITDVRGKIIHQCIDSSYCRLLNCSDDNNRICSYPENVMEVFEHSVFCLQPTGDSYTRRSTFDSMLAGCIPVFFHEFAAYSQYVWHLPANHSSYSVYINVNTTSIEEALLKYSEKEIQSMREVVIQTIPALVYSDPRSSPLGDVRDAFDISLQGVINRITDWKTQTKNGVVEGDGDVMDTAHKATVEAMKRSEKDTALRENASVMSKS